MVPATGRFATPLSPLLALMLAGLAACAMPTAAAAQMMLPGAVAPTPQGTTQAPVKSKPRAAAGEHVAKGVTVAVPGFAGIAGRTVTRNGDSSQVSFAAGKTAAISKLVFTGDKISNPRETCRVEVSGMPMSLTALGKPQGLERYRIEAPACPVTFDVLGGAILVDAAQPVCDFAEADCRVTPVGLWGPPPTDLGPDKVKGLERERAGAEAAVRGNYKALTTSNKDRRAVMGFAHDQAQFSSSREEVCRDYADEGRHGFCATRVTEARAALLHDELDAVLAAKAARKAAKDIRHGTK